MKKERKFYRWHITESATHMQNKQGKGATNYGYRYRLTDIVLSCKKAQLTDEPLQYRSAVMLIIKYVSILFA